MNPPVNPRLPPQLAVWLLNRFASIRENESLLGDLREEFYSGRSVGWYWRQTVTAIACAIGKGSQAPGTNRPAMFIGCGLSIIPVLLLWRLDAPFTSLPVVHSFFALWFPLYLTRKSSRVRKWMVSRHSTETGSFGHQTVFWLMAYLAADLVYLLFTARMASWVGLGGMLIAKLVHLLIEFFKILAQTARLRALQGGRA